MESYPQKLLDQVRDAIRVKHYARKTESGAPRAAFPVVQCTKPGAWPDRLGARQTFSVCADRA